MDIVLAKTSNNFYPCLVVCWNSSTVTLDRFFLMLQYASNITLTTVLMCTSILLIFTLQKTHLNNTIIPDLYTLLVFILLCILCVLGSYVKLRIFSLSSSLLSNLWYMWYNYYLDSTLLLHFTAALIELYYQSVVLTHRL